MRERYWYVVAGLNHGQDDVYVTVSRQHGLQPTLEKAQAELRAILVDGISQNTLQNRIFAFKR